MFNITGGIFLADSLFFILFASGEEQEWNKVTGDQKKNDAKDADAAVFTVPAEEQKPSTKVMQGSDSVGSSVYDKYLSEGGRNWSPNKAFLPD